MFKYVIFVAFIACVAAGNSDADAEVMENMADVRADGFHHKLAISNGIHQSASGDEHGNIKGSYEYISPEGEHVKVEYIADENGYQPSSDLLPTPPPVPEYILKALEYIRTHSSEEKTVHKRGLPLKIIL